MTTQQVMGPATARYSIGPLEVYVRRLRVKLAEASDDWDYIHTHHTIGYRLEPEPRREQS
jgi:DNA-binding response OmpR family regulator